MIEKRREFIGFSPPLLGEDEEKEVLDTLRSGWISTGPKTQKFEEAAVDYLGAKFACAVNSCTAALHLSLVAAGIKENDEVITSPFTFAATGHVICYQKARPVLVDIKKDTFNIDPKKIEERITDKTKAIIPVHYSGQPCDMDEIAKIAEEHNLVVIEDAAHAIGAEYKDKKIGTISPLTCFSFYATKNITTSEGGMAATNNEEYADKIKRISLFGIDKDAWKRYSKTGSWFYDVKFLGYKYNMTDLQASLGLHQLKRIESFLKTRERYAQIYNKELGSLNEIETPFVKKDIKHARHLYPILIKPDSININRDQFIEELKRYNIGTSVQFIPLHLHSYYKDKFEFNKGEFPITEDIYERIINIPISPKIKEEDIMYIINAIKEIINNNKK